MKLRTKSIITLIAMLLGGIGQVTAGDAPGTTVIIQQNGTTISSSTEEGTTTSAAGTMTISFDNPVGNGTAVVTLTVNPAEGNYITAEQISILKTIDGAQAQTRETGIETAFHPTAANADADPSGETVYTFTIEGNVANTRGTEWNGVFFPYDYEITANFLSQTDLTNATITLEEETFTWDGQPKEPAVTKVVVGETEIDAKNYTVSWSDNVEPAEATAEKAPTVFVTGQYTCKNTGTKTFTITKATAELKFSKETATATMNAEFEAPTLTKTPETLEGVKFSSSNTAAATVDEATGAVTLVGAGETTITAAFAGDEHYKEAEASYVLTVNKIATELKYSKETAEATMGAEFEAPILTKSPENLEGVEFTSSNTAAATVDKNTGAVTLVGGGETTIKAAFAGSDTYESSEASYVLTVSKAKTELKFSKETATATMNAEFEAPTLTKTPEDLEGVEFTSSNEAAATVDKNTGAVTLVGAGETTIKAAFAGSTVYEASEASYTLTVNRAAGEGYLLWVNDTQVTSDNAEDVLGHKTDSSKPYYIYNKDKKQLYMDNDQTRTTVIESRMPELTVYIKDANKIKRIFFNNTGDASNKGNLTFTTNGNFPGKLIIANPTKGESAIKGFSNISYNWDLTAIEPDGSYYDTTTLEMKYKKETDAIVIADTITIGEAIVPITEKRAITFEESQLVEKDEDGKVKKDESGNPIKANLSNYSYAPSSTTGEPEKNVIHISLNSANISDDAGGFDIENGVGGIYIEDTMTDEKAGQVAQDVNDNKMVPGGTLYAESYDGFTFKLIAGSGTIEIDEIVENDHEFHLIIGTNKPITLNENNSIIRPYDGKSVRVQAEIAFNVGAPTYCFLYMVKKTAGTRGTRLGKRDKAHGKLVSVQVRSTTVIPTEPPSEATGGVIPKSDDPEPETDPTPPTGIREVKSDKMAVKSGWYTIDGQKIAEPTQRGLYIKDGRKVVIK